MYLILQIVLSAVEWLELNTTAPPSSSSSSSQSKPSGAQSTLTSTQTSVVPATPEGEYLTLACVRTLDSNATVEKHELEPE